MSGVKIGNVELQKEYARQSFPSLKSVHMDEGSANCSEPNSHFTGSVEMRRASSYGRRWHPVIVSEDIILSISQWVAPFALGYPS